MSLQPVVTVGALLGLAVLSGCGGSDASTAQDSRAPHASRTPTDVSCAYNQDGSQPANEVDLPPAKAVVSGTMTASMKTSVGIFHLSLNADEAPCTVNSFVSLADQGFFDNTECHRLTTAGIRLLQCGDPTGTGAGGPGYVFDDELTGTERYPAGTLAMANAGPNTNGSQFFIIYGHTSLPPYYTVFGTVDRSTVAAVRKVASAGTDNADGPGDGRPITPVKISSVIVD